MSLFITFIHFFILICHLYFSDDGDDDFDGDEEEEDDEDGDEGPEKAKTPSLPVCQYGPSCYRKNPAHFRAKSIIPIPFFIFLTF